MSTETLDSPPRFPKLLAGRWELELIKKDGDIAVQMRKTGIDFNTNGDNVKEAVKEAGLPENAVKLWYDGAPPFLTVNDPESIKELLQSYAPAKYALENAVAKNAHPLIIDLKIDDALVSHRVQKKLPQIDDGSPSVPIPKSVIAKLRECGINQHTIGLIDRDHIAAAMLTAIETALQKPGRDPIRQRALKPTDVRRYTARDEPPGRG